MLQKQTLSTFLNEDLERQEVISQCVLLNTLDSDDYHKILKDSRVFHIAENATLFNRGDELKNIFLLYSGCIKLQMLSPSGDEKIIDVIRGGQTFAEAVLFAGGSKYPVNAIASKDSVVIAFNAKTYLSLLKSSNTLCLTMMAKLSQRLHWMRDELDHLTLHNATFRLVSFLLDQVSLEQNKDQASVTLLISKRILASRLSIKPETLSRIFHSLTDKQLIEIHESEIRLLNIPKLREITSL